jgi:hypothetical protein
MAHIEKRITNINDLCSGDKVIFTNQNCGIAYDQKEAEGLLQKDKEYTVQTIELNIPFNKVFIKEVPGIGFNLLAFSPKS